MRKKSVILVSILCVSFSVFAQGTVSPSFFNEVGFSLNKTAEYDDNTISRYGMAC